MKDIPEITDFKHEINDTISDKCLLMILKETIDLCFLYEKELIKRGVEVKPVKRSIGFYKYHIKTQ